MNRLRKSRLKAAPRSESGRSVGARGVITIRLATPPDAPALIRLAQRDSALLPGSPPILLAEADGELRAALALDGGAAIADPFHPTADLVAILRARARQLAATGSRATKSRRRRPRKRLPRAAWSFRV
jgi:hypothetical protein